MNLLHLFPSAPRSKRCTQREKRDSLKVLITRALENSTMSQARSLLVAKKEEFFPSFCLHGLSSHFCSQEKCYQGPDLRQDQEYLELIGAC